MGRTVEDLRRLEVSMDRQHGRGVDCVVRAAHAGPQSMFDRVRIEFGADQHQ